MEVISKQVCAGSLMLSPNLPSFFTVTDCTVVSTVQLVLPVEKKGIVNNSNNERSCC